MYYSIKEREGKPTKPERKLKMVYVVDEKNDVFTGEIFESEHDATCAICDYYGFCDPDYIFIFEYDEDEYNAEFGDEWEE